MCTEPFYAIRLKTEFDEKYRRFKIRTPIKVLKAVRDIGKNTNLLNYDREHYDLIMISCGQCLQCRLLRVKQRSVMCICESLEHEENSFITLTFGYPQTYSYYRHNRKLSHYLSSKKAHFHEWSLETEMFQKFMKRLRNWFYNYQLSIHLYSIGRSDLVPSTFPYVTKIRIPLLERPFLLKDFKPKKIRVMHCGEYGDKKSRPHHHAILFGFQFPDLESVYENGKEYFVSSILERLWPFGIHRIGSASYNSCAYVARYVTKKINGNNKDEYYKGRKPEYVTYSTKPVLGANYFIKNYKEFVNTGVISVVSDKKYECAIPRSYDNILKKIDFDLYSDMKEKRVNSCLTDLDRLLQQDRSIYSKLDSNQKICMSVMRKLVRSYENSGQINYDEYLKKARAFGISVKYFESDLKDRAIRFLDKCTFKRHKPRNSNSELHQKYYQFELSRKRHINKSYNVNHSDERVKREVAFYENMPNPFKVLSRGRFIPDIESYDDDNVCITSKGDEIYA